jgi:hypothetical protein
VPFQELHEHWQEDKSIEVENKAQMPLCVWSKGENPIQMSELKDSRSERDTSGAQFQLMKECESIAVIRK